MHAESSCVAHVVSPHHLLELLRHELWLKKGELANRVLAHHLVLHHLLLVLLVHVLAWLIHGFGGLRSSCVHHDVGAGSSILLSWHRSSDVRLTWSNGVIHGIRWVARNVRPRRHDSTISSESRNMFRRHLFSGFFSCSQFAGRGLSGNHA